MLRENQNDDLVVIVGAGITGLTLAERLANVAKKRVLVLEKRNHIGGNCYDFVNKRGVLVSKYGPHVFHTSHKRVWRYVQRFTEWEKYEHRVVSNVDGKMVPIPVTIDTINILFGLHLKNGEEMERWLESKRVLKSEILNSRDVVISKLGEEVYKLLYRDYTMKQWDMWPEELEPEVLARIPIRYGFDDRYNIDEHQMRPINGFTEMFRKMVVSPRIEIRLSTDYFEVENSLPSRRIVIFTGPIDEYVSYKTGKKISLQYRSIRFGWRSFHKAYYQPVAVVNYPSLKKKVVRVTEYKHLTGQKHDWTTISKEYFHWGGEPYYPVLTPKNREKYIEVEKEARKFKEVYFAGRLGKYRYINMDVAIKEALELFDEIKQK